MSAPFNYLGMTIVLQPLAVAKGVRFVVFRHPHPKRRRQWSVRRKAYETPTAWQIGSTLFVHPIIYEKLKHEQKSRRQALV